MLVHRQTISKQLLDELRANAKKLSREDKTRSYVEWLNFLSRPFGASTYQNLKQQLEDLELNAQKLILEEEESKIWQLRLDGPAPWGTLAPIGPEKYEETFSFPAHEKSFVPWPNCFSTSSLFSAANGPRRQLDNKIFSLDRIGMHYAGEELRVDADENVLMTIIVLSGDLFERIRFALETINGNCGNGKGGTSTLRTSISLKAQRFI